MTGIDGLPAVPETAIPAGVHKPTYRAALAFEQVLLDELVEQVVPEGTLTEGPYAATVREALTSGLVAAGGIGLGAQLYPMLRKDAP